jgi:tetratricopeptide (TPR) repeat protein
MADLNEETTVDNTESNPVEETVETRKPIDPSLQGIQLYYEKNKKVITYVGGALAIIIGAFCFLQLYYIPEQEKEAVNEAFWAEDLFAKDSFNLALKGGATVMSADGPKQMKGFEQLADEYSITKTGNLANYYAGICYLRTGKFEQAISFLDKYKGSDETLAPIALGATGDCYLELNKLDEAVKYYTKAANKSRNTFTSPYFLKKAGFANELKGNHAEALNNYERIQKEFPKSTEAQEIEKHIAKVKALGNL